MRSLSDKLGVRTVLYEFWGPVEGKQSLNEGGRSCSLPHPVPTACEGCLRAPSLGALVHPLQPGVQSDRWGAGAVLFLTCLLSAAREEDCA